jgi:hypothetical protein
VAERFELSEVLPSHAFEACSLGRSDTPPRKTLHDPCARLSPRRRHRICVKAPRIAPIERNPAVTEAARWHTWTGVLAIEGTPDDAGRTIDRGALGWPMMPVALFRIVENAADSVGRVDDIRRVEDRLEASGRIAGYPEGTVMSVHLHIDAQGVRTRSDGDFDARRVQGGNISGARLVDSTGSVVQITVGAPLA